MCERLAGEVLEDVALGVVCLAYDFVPLFDLGGVDHIANGEYVWVIGELEGGGDFDVAAGRQGSWP